MTSRPSAPARLVGIGALTLPGVVQAVTTREAGSLSFALGDDPAAVRRRRRALAEALEIEPRQIVCAQQVHGALVARTDFAWEEHELVGEFDGKVKYGRLLRPGQEPGDAVFEEKRREDAVRAEGWGVARWVWADLGTGHRLAARLRRAFDRRRR